MKNTQAVRVVLDQCLKVGQKESLVIVVDEGTRNLGNLFHQEGRRMGAESVLVDMISRENNGMEPPLPVARALQEAGAAILLTSRSLSHTRARREACLRGARVASMPGLTEDMLARTLGEGVGPVVRLSALAAGALTGDLVRVNTPAGTDLSFSIRGRTAHCDDGNLTARGAFGNLPAGEAYIAPLEGTARGTLVIDGSMAGIGLLDEPIRIQVEEGLARQVSGGPQARQLDAILERYGSPARNIAELGIGTNPFARLTGAILEDEKVLGTVHIALGDNASMGGTVEADSHLDGVLLHPTVTVDGRILVEDGRILPYNEGDGFPAGDPCNLANGE